MWNPFRKAPPVEQLAPVMIFVKDLRTTCPSAWEFIHDSIYNLSPSKITYTKLVQIGQESVKRLPSRYQNTRGITDVMVAATIMIHVDLFSPFKGIEWEK